jgi:hypothetical protein
VIQAGKWRRVVTIPSVVECVDTPLDGDLTRFPRVQGEAGIAENNIPRIALTTGGADALECLLRKIGIDSSEFTPQADDGRVNLYAGVGGTNRYAAAVNEGVAFSTAQSLWDDAQNLNDYDMVVLSCEGAGDDPGNRGPTALASMKSYLDDFGGRVFGSHWHHSWVELGPDPMPTVAAHGHRQPVLPEGSRPRRVAGERRRLAGERPAPAPRRPAHHRRDQPGGGAGLDHRHQPERGRRRRRRVPLLQHPDRRSRR